MTEFADLVQRIEPHPRNVSDYVAKHARRGDPADVLATMDRYAREERFLMNIGPDKGALVEEVFDRIPSDARILEVGAYCGYSAVLFASKLGEGGSLVSLAPSSISSPCAPPPFTPPPAAIGGPLTFSSKLTRMPRAVGTSSNPADTLSGAPPSTVSDIAPHPSR